MLHKEVAKAEVTTVRTFKEFLQSIEDMGGNTSMLATELTIARKQLYFPSFHFFVSWSRDVVESR